MFPWTRKGVAVLLLLLFTQTAHPCTTFLLENNGKPLFGRNYDWSAEDALLVTNKKNVTKTALLLNMLQYTPARWTSKFGSVTFDQICREFPCGGMNEAGLVVEVMVVDESMHNEAAGRPAISNLQWIQYQLDNYASVAMVVAHASDLCIVNETGFALHYLVADVTGDAAAIEVLNGKVACHTGKSMPIKVLANDTYETHVNFMKECEGFGGNRAIAADDADSLFRFVRAAKGVKDFQPSPDQSPIDAAFDILHNVKQGCTMWSIVHDITNRRIYFQTRSYSGIRHVDLARFDFSCKTPVKVFDISTPVKGDTGDWFKDYTIAANRNLIHSVFGQLRFLRNFQTLASAVLPFYPETTVCAEN